MCGGHRGSWSHFFSNENNLKVTEKLEGMCCSWLNACVKPLSLSWTPNACCVQQTPTGYSAGKYQGGGRWRQESGVPSTGGCTTKVILSLVRRW